MTTTDIVAHLLGLLAGVGTFMYACDVISDNLQAVSSERLKSLFLKVSNNKIIGVCIGALTTTIIQSSGATTVMLIGFVNAGIISLNQAATIILGSEIGTTLTGQIVALGLGGESTISLNTVFGAFIGIGAFLELFAKKDKTKKIAGVMIGFGMIFVGLSMMSSSMDSFARLDSLKVFLASIDSVVLLTVVGAILTALIHSSSAMTSIAITMIASGLISLEQGIYITLGANVGTCVTGMLAAMGSGANARRTSLFQLIFNAGGVVLLEIVDGIVKALSGNAASVSILFENLFPDVPQTQLAMFHTLFNVASTILALPISNQMASLTALVIKDDEVVESSKKRLYFFDENMMSSPSIAVAQIKNEIVNMLQISIVNFNASLEMVSKLDFSYKEEFNNNEDELNYLNHTLVDIVSRLSKVVKNANDLNYLSSTYRTISDIERIGDYAENIMEYAEFLSDSMQAFSDTAVEEIKEVQGYVNDIYNIVADVYKKYDKSKVKKAEVIEEKVDDFTKKMEENHIDRMNNGECNAAVGAQYLQLASDVERVSDHLMNIVNKDLFYIKKSKKN